ncbi:MAG: glycosyltransferase family 4 protein [Pirellulaceae bacterium]
MTSNMNPDQPVRRILLECTDTFFTDWNTGIQRVVRNVANECAEIGKECDVECKPIIRIGDRFLALPEKSRLGCRRSSGRLKWADRWFARDTWDRHRALRLLRRLGVRLRKLVYPRSLVRKLTSLQWSWQGETVIPGEGDTLVLLDAWWDCNIWPSVARARHHGATIGVVVYDLLPITNPEFFKASVKEPFTASLHIALEQGDYFIAISDAVRDALRGYVTEHGPPRKLREASFLSFRLGSTLDPSDAGGEVRDGVRRAFCRPNGQPPYLTVGTIEPRKNHTLLLDAFDQVWTRYPDATLCIVGRIGWLREDVVGRIVAHPQYNRSLFMFNDLSDAELAYSYQHAKGLLFPSHAEGFGLPVVEALQHGLPVLLSDIPIHREVGREFCTYFDHHSPDVLARLICDVEATGHFPEVRPPDDFALPSWAESTREFLGKCLRACQYWERSAHSSRKAA